MSSKPVKGTFTVTNTGSEDLLLLNVVSSCGCTTVDWTRTPIRPGKTGSINVQYTHNGGPGPFEKTVMVQIAGMDQRVNLKIIGEAFESIKSKMDGFEGVIGPLRIRNNRLNAGEVPPGGKKKGYATVFNTSSKDVTVSFINPNHRLSILSKPEIIPAGGEGRIWYTVTSSGYDAGYIEFKAVPVIDGKKTAPLYIYASAHVAGARAKAGVDEKIKYAEISGRSYRNSFTISNSGDADLVIKRIESSSNRSGNITAEVQSRVIGPGQSTELTVTGKPGSKRFLDTVCIFTNDPEHSEIKMFVTDDSNKAKRGKNR